MKKIILQKLKHLSKKCGLLFSPYLIMDINVFMITEILLFPLSVLTITDRNFMAVLQLIYGNFLTQMSKFAFWVTGWVLAIKFKHFNAFTFLWQYSSSVSLVVERNCIKTSLSKFCPRFYALHKKISFPLRISSFFVQW